MIFWSLVTIMLAVAAVFVLWPLGGRVETNDGDPRKAVLVERLAQIEDSADSETERAQIGRQLLSLEENRPKRTEGSSAVLVASLLALVTIPALVIPLYLSLGSPAAAVLAGNADALENQPLDVMVATAERHLKQNPDDVQGWTVLARVYATQGQVAKRVTALENLVRLQPQNNDWKADLAQVLAEDAGNVIPDRAIVLLDDALRAEPNHQKANFFRAVAYEQTGDRDAALATWQRLAAMRPEDPKWQEQMRQRIAALSGPSDTSVSQTQRALQAAPEDVRNDMINEMVKGLADRLRANPDDLQGWRRLMQAYTVLGTPEIALGVLDTTIAGQPEGSDLRARLTALRASANEVR